MRTFASLFATHDSRWNYTIDVTWKVPEGTVTGSGESATPPAFFLLLRTATCVGPLIPRTFLRRAGGADQRAEYVLFVILHLGVVN